MGKSSFTSFFLKHSPFFFSPCLKDPMRLRELDKIIDFIYVSEAFKVDTYAVIDLTFEENTFL